MRVWHGAGVPGDIGPINNGRVLTIRRVEEGAVEGRAARGGLTRREGGHGGVRGGRNGRKRKEDGEDRGRGPGERQQW